MNKGHNIYVFIIGCIVRYTPFCHGQNLVRWMISIVYSTTGTVQTRYRLPAKGQLKKLAGFLVSNGLTLPSSLPWIGGVTW